MDEMKAWFLTFRSNKQKTRCRDLEMVGNRLCTCECTNSTTLYHLGACCSLRPPTFVSLILYPPTIRRAFLLWFPQSLRTSDAVSNANSLSFYGSWSFPFKGSTRKITNYHPATICQHIPCWFSFISFLHSGNVLMKSLTLFIADSS